MPASDLDIYRSAHLFIQLQGDGATAKAREMVEEMRRKGDNDGHFFCRLILPRSLVGHLPQ